MLKKTSESGVTLIELLIGIVLFSIIVGGICGVLNMVWGSNQRAMGEAYNIQEARQSINSIVDALQFADEINQIEPTRVIFTERGGTTAGSSIAFDSSTGIITLQRSDGTTVRLSRNIVQNMTIERDANDPDYSIIVNIWFRNSEQARDDQAKRIRTRIRNLNNGIVTPNN